MSAEIGEVLFSIASKSYADNLIGSTFNMIILYDARLYCSIL